MFGTYSINVIMQDPQGYPGGHATKSSCTGIGLFIPGWISGQQNTVGATLEPTEGAVAVQPCGELAWLSRTNIKRVRHLVVGSVEELLCFFDCFDPLFSLLTRI